MLVVLAAACAGLLYSLRWRAIRNCQIRWVPHVVWWHLAGTPAVDRVRVIVAANAERWNLATCQRDLFHNTGLDESLVVDAVCTLIARGEITDRWTQMPSGLVRLFSPAR